MPQELQSQLILGGAAVALALIIIDRVLAFIRPTNSSQSTEFGRRQDKENFSEVLKEAVIPILQKQVEILDELKINASRLIEMQIKAQLTIDAVMVRQENVNQNVHQLRTDLQNLGNSLRSEISALDIERRKGRG